MRSLKKLLIFILVVSSLCVLIVVLFRLVVNVKDPVPADLWIVNAERVEIEKDFYSLENNWFRKSESGLYELYVEGDPFERGVANGKLTRELVQYQEAAFNKQINLLVPSNLYRGFLKYFVGWFNRNLDDHVEEEFKLESFAKDCVETTIIFLSQDPLLVMHVHLINLSNAMNSFPPIKEKQNAFIN